MRVVKAVSTEYVECTVSVFNVATNLPVDPSADVVQMAFPQVGVDPVAGDWKPAIWTAVRRAGILIGSGTGGLALAKGDYDWWGKITDNPELPTDKVDTLRVE